MSSAGVNPLYLGLSLSTFRPIGLVPVTTQNQGTLYRLDLLTLPAHPRRLTLALFTRPCVGR